MIQEQEQIYEDIGRDAVLEQIVGKDKKDEAGIRDSYERLLGCIYSRVESGEKKLWKDCQKEAERIRVSFAKKRRKLETAASYKGHDAGLNSRILEDLDSIKEREKDGLKAYLEKRLPNCAQESAAYVSKLGSIDGIDRKTLSEMALKDTLCGMHLGEKQQDAIKHYLSASMRLDRRWEEGRERYLPYDPDESIGMNIATILLVGFMATITVGIFPIYPIIKDVYLPNRRLKKELKKEKESLKEYTLYALMEAHEG